MSLDLVGAFVLSAISAIAIGLPALWYARAPGGVALLAAHILWFVAVVALAGSGAWITGQRRAQSVTRNAVEIEEIDAAHAIRKFNPLADWSEDEVWTYIRDHGVPYNTLHDRGYPSIGCAPCTRALLPGEDIRAGRWWWKVRTTRSADCIDARWT